MSSFVLPDSVSLAMGVRAYIRVSTADQRCELQVRELREYAERWQWQIAEIYGDVSSGAKTSRPAAESADSGRRSKKI
jgi:DNA invertase Pin-like site-specific DNA recombinase